MSEVHIKINRLRIVMKNDSSVGIIGSILDDSPVNNIQYQQCLEKFITDETGRVSMLMMRELCTDLIGRGLSHIVLRSFETSINRGMFGMVQRFLSFNFFPLDTTARYGSKLITWSISHSYEMFRMFLDHAPEHDIPTIINCVDTRGYSCLHYAIHELCVSSVRLLIDLGADVNSSSGGGNIGTIKNVLISAAGKFKIGSQRISAGRSCIARGDVEGLEIFRMLIAAGAIITSEVFRDCLTGQSDPGYLMTMINAGFDIKKQYMIGGKLQTLADYAVSVSSVVGLRILLANGAEKPIYVEDEHIERRRLYGNEIKSILRPVWWPSNHFEITSEDEQLIISEVTTIWYLQLSEFKCFHMLPRELLYHIFHLSVK